jgi:hypothetical protein
MPEGRWNAGCEASRHVASVILARCSGRPDRFSRRRGVRTARLRRAARLHDLVARSAAAARRGQGRGPGSGRLRSPVERARGASGGGQPRDRDRRDRPRPWIQRARLGAQQGGLASAPRAGRGGRESLSRNPAGRCLGRGHDRDHEDDRQRGDPVPPGPRPRRSPRRRRWGLLCLRLRRRADRRRGEDEHRAALRIGRRHPDDVDQAGGPGLPEVGEEFDIAVRVTAGTIKCTVTTSSGSEGTTLVAAVDGALDGAAGLYTRQAAALFKAARICKTKA